MLVAEASVNVNAHAVVLHDTVTDENDVVALASCVCNAEATEAPDASLRSVSVIVAEAESVAKWIPNVDLVSKVGDTVR